jgi:hypothetical protein
VDDVSASPGCYCVEPCDRACLNWLGRPVKLSELLAELDSPPAPAQPRQCTQCSQPLHSVLTGAVLVQQSETVREVCARCARDLEVFGWVAVGWAKGSQA